MNWVGNEASLKHKIDFFPKSLTSMIHYFIHELHPTDEKVIFDQDEKQHKKG